MGFMAMFTVAMLLVVVLFLQGAVILPGSSAPVPIVSLVPVVFVVSIMTTSRRLVVPGGLGGGRLSILVGMILHRHGGEGQGKQGAAKQHPA